MKIIKINNVSKNYKNIKALNNISLSIIFFITLQTSIFLSFVLNTNSYITITLLINNFFYFNMIFWKN